MTAAVELSADEARRISLAAQGFLGAPDRSAGVAAMLRRLGSVQLDTISVLARSHELVAYARLGPVGRATVEQAYWGGDAFEYWAHAACILPIEDWPWSAARRRLYLTYRNPRKIELAKARDAVRKRVAEGPVTASQLGGAKKGGPWWDWSDVKIAAERMFARGELVCVTRRGWKRVYDLPERVIPAELLALDPTDDECWREQVGRAGRCLGVGTRKDLANYYNLKLSRVDSHVADTDLVPVRVAGWPDDQPAWAHPYWLEQLSAGRLRGRHRTTLLSPFDSLVWERSRSERMFGFTHKIEAYTPAPQRVYGYYPMPLLTGGRLVGRIDPGRSGRTLVAKQVALDSPKWADAAATALVEAAAWVGCDNVAIERVDPPVEVAELVRAVAAAQAPA